MWLARPLAQLNMVGWAPPKVAAKIKKWLHTYVQRMGVSRTLAEAMIKWRPYQSHLLRTICMGELIRVSRGHYRAMEQPPTRNSSHPFGKRLFSDCLLAPLFCWPPSVCFEVFAQVFVNMHTSSKGGARQTTQNINLTSKLQRLVQNSFLCRVVRLSRVNTWRCLSIKISHKHNTGQLMIIRAKIMSITSNNLCAVRIYM